MITSYREAFELYLRNQEMIKCQLSSLIQDEEAVAEIGQRIVEKITRSCCNGRQIKNEGGWVRVIARNAAYDYFKECRRLQLTIPQEQEGDCQFIDNPYHQLEAYLPFLVEFLPQKYAEPLRLDLFERVPQREIAELLGLSLSAAKSRIQRARVLLRREIECCFALEWGGSGGLVSVALRKNCTPLQNIEKSSDFPASFSSCCSQGEKRT